MDEKQKMIALMAAIINRGHSSASAASAVDVAKTIYLETIKQVDQSMEFDAPETNVMGIVS